jgi:hypothetical protein
MCRAMPTTSYGALGVMLSGAALAGWLAGSALNPPVAATQTGPARPAAAPVARAELPRLQWPSARPHVAPPAPARNPFTFHASPHAAGDGVTATPAEGAESALPPESGADATAAVPELAWRLAGIATNDGGDVIAVIGGGGDVHLMRAGDVLPGGDEIVEVGPTHVVVRTAAGPVTLRLP